MPFLAISTFLMYANLIAAIRYYRRGGDHARLLGAGHFLAVLTGSIGFLVGTELLVFDRDGGIAGNAYNWTPVIYAAFGLLSFVLFGYKFYRKIVAKDAEPSIGFVFGMVLWAGLGGFYVLSTTVDHFLFFRDPMRTGQMEVAFSGEKLTCSGDIILVRMETDTAVYRCPASLRLGRDYSQPFIPWPSYIEGSSAKLKAVTDSMQETLKHRPDIVSIPGAEIKIIPNAGGANE